MAVNILGPSKMITPLAKARKNFLTTLYILVDSGEACFMDMVNTNNLTTSKSMRVSGAEMR